MKVESSCYALIISTLSSFWRELSFFVQENNYASEFYIYRDSSGCCLFMEARVYDYNELLAVDEF